MTPAKMTIAKFIYGPGVSIVSVANRKTVGTVAHLLWGRVPVDRPKSPEKGVDCVSESNAVDHHTPHA